MSRTVLVVAFTVLCLTEINGMYARSGRPWNLARFGEDKGFVVKDADESNGRGLNQFGDKVIMKLFETYIPLFIKYSNF